MKKLIITLTVIMLVISITNCTKGDKKVTLKYKYVQGLELEYHQDTKRLIKVYEADSLIKDYGMDYTVDMSQTVNKIDENGVAEVIEIQTWAHEAPSKEDTTKMEKQSSTDTLVLWAKSNGEIVDFKFGEDKSITHATYVKNYWKQGMPQFPDKEVAPGYSWTQNTTVVLPDETMKASTTFIVKHIARELGYDCAVIEFDGNMIIPIEPNKEDSVYRTGVDKIRATGTLYFAFKEGIVIMQKERWVIDGVRQKIEGDKTTDYTLEVTADSEFILKKMAKN